MTFTIKTRGAGGPMIAEYWCENHGRIEKLVQRDEKGDPPEFVRCDAYLDTGGVIEARYGIEPHCDQVCELVISAPQTKKDSVPCYAAVRGGDMKDRPPGMLDTRPLAEGMPMSEWKQLQKKHSEERRHKQLIERGLKTKRIQSP